MPANTRSRFLGALLGLAAGDAVGTTVEFKPRGTFPPVTDMTGGGPFDLAPGEWTDDTSMALCLAQSLLGQQGFDPIDQLKKYLAWRDEGYLSSNGRCFDIGTTINGAIGRFVISGEPWCGPTDPRTAGNGSIMRLAPVPMFYFSTPAEALEKCALSSKTTHGAPVAIDACRYLGALLLGALAGVPKKDLLANHYSPVSGYWEQQPLVPEISIIAAGSFLQKTEAEIRGSGYAAHTLEAALWCFAHTDTFMDGCLKTVNLGEDSDTTAAVYGQLAGAYYGEDSIPKSWRQKLAKNYLIEQIALDLFDHT